MSNFLIFKASFDRSATPEIGTYTAEGGTPQYIQNLSLSPDYYMYVATAENPAKWFVPTVATVTDFEFVCDILTRTSNAGYAPYFTIADSNGVTKLRMESQYSNIRFMSDDTHGQSASVICLTSPTDIGGYDKFHQFRIRIRKLTDSSSSVEVYANDVLVTSGTSPALITCGKISFLGATGAFATGNTMGVKHAYVYDLSGGEVIDRGVLSNAFTRFIGWAKSIFATQDNVVLRSGGNLMTGSKLGRPDNAGTFSISGGTTVGGQAGYVKCYGATESTYPGAVEIGGKNIKFIFRNGAIESWSGNQDLGSSGRQFGTAYIKALTINGAAAGDILTHNAAEFVNVTTAQTIAGDKTFTGTTTAHDLVPSATDTYNFGSSSAQWNNAYIKSLTINGAAAGDILTHNASEFVPRSGGAVLTGAWLGTTFNNNALSIIGGTEWNKGGTIYLNGKDRNILAGAVCLRATNDTSASEFQLYPNGNITHDFIDFNKSNTDSRITINGGTTWNCGASISAYGSTQSEYPGRILFNAATSGSNSSIMWLQPDGTWTWNGTAVQITSDQRYKQQINEIDDKLLDAWESVELVQFKYNDAVSEKGDKARLHTGFVVQQIDKACKEHGVDISNYGLYCHEEYPEETEEVEVTQKDGSKTRERKVIREANEHYSLRYTEALIVECKYLRRCVERLTARIEELEKGKEQEASK